MHDFVITIKLRPFNRLADSGVSFGRALTIIRQTRRSHEFELVSFAVWEGHQRHTIYDREHGWRLKWLTPEEQRKLKRVLRRKR
jgi:hypothetical protein